ncbi:RNA polymerase sigma-70 factor, sigma-E family [Asanoa hainanensis]|uniref:RNA polymerase sigma-70 factor, sigma-E family n=1 Tax=Asanoa hainanensis TaxID=560556 RepID=A0A239LNF7_9ACTN|nr:SigE family RNA polymerase sigma factor [Asanoa hainanensis]SNT31830.1 RNA polymerase sigma-70 factor, sigma-E family [Asanoa hainanensis]
MAAEDSFRDYVAARLVGLSRAAYLLTGDRHLAEDLVQQALVQVASRWEKISAGGDPDPYVRRVLYHQHVSWWRWRRLVDRPHADLPETAVADRGRDVDTELTVRQALRRLTPKQRAVLVLRYFEDLTEAQTAEVLGCSVGTVKSNTRDALARLRTTAPELADLREAR